MSIRTVIEINHDYLRPSQLEELRSLYETLAGGSLVSTMLGKNNHQPFNWSRAIKILGQHHHSEKVHHVPFQNRVAPWMMACFGKVISADTVERNHRFLEEALELVQACDCSQHEAHQLVDYVYNRAVGEKPQEVGGVMVTLAALCLAQKIDMHQCGEVELERIWTKVEQIRQKQASKPRHSPLPV